MIELNDSLLFAKGGRRLCFVHPDDPGKCVKTLSPNGNPAKRRKEAVWYKKLRPLSMFDDNLRELKSFQNLGKKGKAVWNHFPRCYGLQPTNRGDGIVTDLIRDADGSISKTVRQYIKENGKTPELLSALDEFFNLFRVEQIVTRDFLDHNLVVQNNVLSVQATGSPCAPPLLFPKPENLKPNTLNIYMIDGFGSAEMLPISCWFPSLCRKKVERKVGRFKQRYSLRCR